MSTQPNHNHHVGKAEHVIRKILHLLELGISALTIIVLLVSLCVEIFHLFTEPGYITDIHHFLHNVLTIVVGVEFVRMLIDLTPANTLEVLVMACARYVIMNHDSPVSLVVGVACVGGLFAIRRFLIPKDEMSEELVEIE